MRDDKHTTMFDAQTCVAAEVEQMLTQTAKKTSKFVEVGSAAKEGERPATRAKLVLGWETSLEAPPAVTYTALFAERDESMNHYEELKRKNQCILSLAKQAKEQRLKVANIEKSNASAKSTSAKGGSRKRPTVAEKRVIALVAQLKDAQEGQKQSTDVA